MCIGTSPSLIEIEIAIRLFIYFSSIDWVGLKDIFKLEILLNKTTKIKIEETL